MSTILVVDDERDIRETLRTLLEKDGHTIITAVDGTDCLNKLNARPDLILLDIMMPGAPAKEIIRSAGRSNIILISAIQLSQKEKKELLKPKKVKAFIPKPFDVDALREKIRRVVNTRRNAKHY